MLYELFKYLQSRFDFPGSGLVHYLSFRSAMAILLSLVIAWVFGKYIIRLLQRKQIGEEIRNLGLEGQLSKKGTPTMGGVIILLSILAPVLLFGDLSNIYIRLMIITTLWIGAIGFLDDYIKVFRKNKAGLHGRFKIVGQIGLGLIVGLTMFFCDDVVTRERVAMNDPDAHTEIIEREGNRETIYLSGNIKSTQTTIPFVKGNEFDYSWLSPVCGDTSQTIGWIIYVLVVILIVVSVSNGANLTDGMDGLLSGISIIIGLVLLVFAYLSGNIIYADYLNIMYIPHSGELVVFMAAFIGALVGFLWYNSYPAQVFMGDTGSLSLGGIIAVFCIVIRKELLIPLLCGIFFVESLSVMLQVAYFKYTKKKYGEGRRIFKMSPLHHHFQKGSGEIPALIQRPAQPLPESKIVIRFWIVTVLLAVLTIVTLKVR
ncbi:MAG: phospho-N-acetylmuramoyl-pentapeptide-transferase [Bacteroidales bacterium]|nr:phospho-N-acetylmuramoyl-pentapeptide-transferase [Bacteroidales bacterium]MCL2133231.1 phospho-N-acetylmuramoyl-pentapeptide-transferase [Bacteroidales bacterium]MCL2133583.1 phospho-N-acetylmuramoyl-pentapeptide-transferase [Bacteroidales bacterium]